MRLLIIFLILFSSDSIADIVSFSECQSGRLSTVKEAFCNELYSLGNEADQRFTFALSNAKNITQWDELNNIRNLFMSHYYNCQLEAAKRNSKFSTCLRPHLEEAITTLPKFDTNAYSDSEIRIKARSANNMAVTLMEGQFRNCIYKRLETLDDNVSTANDIAIALGEWCRSDATKLTNTELSGTSHSLIYEHISWDKQKALADTLLEPSKLIKYVLEYRVKKRNHE